MAGKPKKEEGSSRLAWWVYRFFRWAVKLFYPKIEVEGAENLPGGPCIVVGNHSQMNGPIASELYFPGPRAIWCAGEMMHLKDVPGYAYKDFWSGKPKAVRWFYKLLSYIIAPLSVCIFNNAHTIPVYRDARIVTTFRRTIAAMGEGKRIVIFPECPEKRNVIVNQFQDRFVSVAKMLYRRTGETVSFVPMYLAPKLKKMYLGPPVAFDPAAPEAEERRRICDAMAAVITDIAVHLPEHTVIPYDNISPKLYRKNTAQEVENGV